MSFAIDLRQFRYFIALSETRHFGRAAERLHISQPPLSRQIRQLEELLGVQLVLRVPSGVVLTDAGKAFLIEAKRTVLQAENAVRAARAAGALDGGRFVVGYTTVFDRSVIPDVLEDLRQRFPGWTMVVRGKHSINLVRDLKKGIVDAAYIALHTECVGLKTETIREEPVVVALPSGHRLARKRRIGFDDLRGEPMFWFERRLNPGFYDHCQRFFEGIDFVPLTIPEPSDHHITLGLIAEGQGVALIPASLQRVKRDGVAFRAMKADEPRLSMGLVVAYSDQNRSPVFDTFLTLVRAAS